VTVRERGERLELNAVGASIISVGQPLLTSTANAQANAATKLQEVCGMTSDSVGG
jgi:hypothetical protein